MIHVVATAHGTDNPEGRATSNLIREQLAAVLNEKEAGAAYTVYEAYPEAQEPNAEAVLARFSANDTVVIVPLWLSLGDNSQINLTSLAEKSPTDVKIARALGPSAALARLQRQRLEKAGWDGYGDLVMAAEGTANSEGKYVVEMQSQIFSTLISQWTPHGFIAGAEPEIADVIEENQADFVSSFLLTPGHWQSELVNLAETGESPTVTEPLVLPGDLAAARLVAEVALERLEEALAN